MLRRWRFELVAARMPLAQIQTGAPALIFLASKLTGSKLTHTAPATSFQPAQKALALPPPLRTTMQRHASGGTQLCYREFEIVYHAGAKASTLHDAQCRGVRPMPINPCERRYFPSHLHFALRHQPLLFAICSQHVLPLNTITTSMPLMSLVIARSR